MPSKSHDIATPLEIETDTVARVGYSADITTNEPESNNDINSVVEVIVDSIAESVVEPIGTPETNQPVINTESGTDAKPSPRRDLTALTKLNMTEGFKSADPVSNDSKDIAH